MLADPSVNLLGNLAFRKALILDHTRFIVGPSLIS